MLWICGCQANLAETISHLEVEVERERKELVSTEEILSDFCMMEYPNTNIDITSTTSSSSFSTQKPDEESKFEVGQLVIARRSNGQFCDAVVEELVDNGGK